jgi:crotonobetainyl-CoA:carnitine CoA-transferase CaiB-like acyl-CoA transferase
MTETLAALWRLAALRETALRHAHLTGMDPVLPSSFRVGTAAQASIAAAALAAAELRHARGQPRQDVAVDMRHAAIEFRSERYCRVDGKPAPEPWDRIAGTYRCADGRWLRLHTNFPHHRDGMLKLLGCAYDREAVKEALSRWNAAEFEDAAAAAGLVVTMMRSFAEWDAHPQGAAIARLPLFTIERIGEASPHPLPKLRDATAPPLAGLRVLELTRIIAGPVSGRVLAAHGADVLHVSAPHLPSIGPLVIDTGRGKRTCHIDLRGEAGRATLGALLRDADVFVQGYRPGAIAGQGFGPQEVATIRPGIVYVTLSAYGHEGPWAGRRGFDSLTQTASGINHAEAEAEGKDAPRPLPCQALDHAAGYLLAFGAMAALLRRAEQGGSWHVRVSLAQTGRWIRNLGRVDDGLAAPDPGYEQVADLLETTDSGFGALTAVRHAAQLSQTPARWIRPSMPLGSHRAAW